jgi:hypothetical protein
MLGAAMGVVDDQAAIDNESYPDGRFSFDLLVGFHGQVEQGDVHGGRLAGSGRKVEELGPVSVIVDKMAQ